MQERHWRMRLVLATSLLVVGVLAGLVRPLVTDAQWRPTLPLGLDLYMPVAEDNPLTRDKVELGRTLFADPILSRDESLACSTCHDPHGSNHPGMISARGPMLCQGCHSQDGHPSFAYGPGGLAEAGASKYLLGQNCMNCHTQVHGSNHPSGSKLMR